MRNDKKPFEIWFEQRSESLTKTENVDFITEEENSNCLELKDETNEEKSTCTNSKSKEMQDELVSQLCPRSTKKITNWHSN